MAKPSIFSRDYERRMKKRKRNITIITIVVIALAVFVFVKVKVQNTDFSNLKSKIQAWVDSGKPQEESSKEEEVPIENSEEQKKEEAPKKLEYDFTLPNGTVIKANYSEDNGNKVFQGVQDVNGIAYSINPSKNKIIFTDQNQNLMIGNIDGTTKNLTKTDFSSSKGQIINKDQILQTYPQNIWHSQAKFIDDINIIYYSNLPYVGGGVQDKYFWIVNSDTAQHTMIQGLVGTEVSIGNLNPANGIEVAVNGYNYYVKADGTYIQNDAAPANANTNTNVDNSMQNGGQINQNIQ